MKAGTFKTNSLNIKIGKENKGNKNQLILKIGATSRFKKRKSHIMNISTFNNILNRINPEKNNINIISFLFLLYQKIRRVEL